jgi:hypothetical protein
MLRREAELRAELEPSDIDPEADAAFQALVGSRQSQPQPTRSATIAGDSNVCSPTMARVERRYELDRLWRSIAMLTPNARAVMSREEALELLTELGELHRRIDVLRTELRRLAEEL